MSLIADCYARRLTVRQLALDLMARHGLLDWTFAFNRRKRSMGLCRYAEKRIELSIYLVLRAVRKWFSRTLDDDN